MFNLGMGEITVILLLALIFLGPSKLPDLAAGLGKLIREIRKATNDVKNEINIDDSFRKPFEELRDAVTLHPDELKRRDQIKRSVEEARKRAEAETARAAAEAAAAAMVTADATIVTAAPPGLEPVPAAPEGQAEATATLTAASKSPAHVMTLAGTGTEATSSHPLPEPIMSHAPIETAPGHAPELVPPVAPPAGTVARGPASASSETAAAGQPGPPPVAHPVAVEPPPPPRPRQPTPAPRPRQPTPGAGILTSAPPPPGAPRVTPPVSSLSGDRANITQTLSEADLLATTPGPARRPTSPPPLPGIHPHQTSSRQTSPLGRVGAPRVTPPVSSLSGDRANATQTLSETDLLPPGAPPLPAGAAKSPPSLPGVPTSGAHESNPPKKT